MAIPEEKSIEDNLSYRGKSSLDFFCFTTESFSEVVSVQDWGIGPIIFFHFWLHDPKAISFLNTPTLFFPNTMISLEAFLWIISNLTTYFLNCEYQNRTYYINRSWNSAKCKSRIGQVFLSIFSFINCQILATVAIFSADIYLIIQYDLCVLLRDSASQGFISTAHHSLLQGVCLFIFLC